VYYVDARDVIQLADMYGQNATAAWENAGPLTGTYLGQDNIKILFGITIGKETALAAMIANYGLMIINPTETNATFSLAVNGADAVTGNVSFAVGVSQEWNYYPAVSGGVGQGQWQIVKENWNFTMYDGEYPLGYGV
jgi:hypothetical protein